jgi:signal transduction histidine kinase
MKRWWTPSLFWTFAGSFLVVLVVAAAVQAMVVLAVVRPLSERLMTERAERLVRDVGAEIAATPGDDAAVREVLRHNRPEGRSPVLLYRSDTGIVVPGRPLGPSSQRRLERLLDGETGSGEVESPRSREPGPPDAGPPDAAPGEPGRPGPGRGERAFSGRMRVLARHPVVTASGSRGEVVAIGPQSRFPVLPPGGPANVFLFLPVAVLVAGIAGLVLFRVLIRRVRAMDALALRVSEGDLTARIPDTGSDEIGRLGTSLNRMTASLSQARDRIEADDRQRRQLLADISHELATPLTSIRGYAETLLDPGVPVSTEEEAAYLNNVLAEAERMGMLISDLFDLTRLEAGAIELVTERLDWTALCRHTRERFLPRFRDAGLALQWQGPGEPAWVEADGRRLEQALDNLLTNALRYVPEGGTVALSMAAVNGGFRLTVADDGPGIPSEALPHVFDRFFRADPARSSEGSGLGLAIVQEVLRRHGGSVRAEARAPRGTAFHLELPAA